MVGVWCAYQTACFLTAKFNCSVPGTLPTNSSECSSTADDMATTPISDTQKPTTLRLPPTLESIQTMTDSTTSVVSPPSTIEIGSPLFYGIVGAGAAVIIVTLFCMICICILFGCRRECKCECYTLLYFALNLDNLIITLLVSGGPKVGATNKGKMTVTVYTWQFQFTSSKAYQVP